MSQTTTTARRRQARSRRDHTDETLGQRAVRLARVAVATHMAEAARRSLDPTRSPRWSDSPLPPAFGPRFAEGAD